VISFTEWSLTIRRFWLFRVRTQWAVACYHTLDTENWLSVDRNKIKEIIE
jgi:hypothetical protein